MGTGPSPNQRDDDRADHGHDRWESLAISHVLGGLGDNVEADFRRHLVGCPSCKSQVRELRDLAGTLTTIARQEQAALAIRTRAREDVEDDTPSARSARSPSWWTVALAAAIVLAVALLTVVAFDLRTQVAGLARHSGHQAEILAALGTGLVIDDTVLHEGVSGVVVSDGSHIGWSVSNLPEPKETQRLAIWLVGPRGVQLVNQVGSVGESGTLSDVVEDDQAVEFVVSLAEFTDLQAIPPDGPVEVVGRRLVESDLSLVRSGSH